jgi:signal transduction histidine kinase
MRMRTFFHDRLGEVAIFVLAVVVSDLVLRASGCEQAIVALVDGILVIGGVTQLVVGFVRDRGFWSGVEALARTGGEDAGGPAGDAADAAVQASLLPEPDGALATTVSDAIDRVLADATRKVSVARLESEEHREYVETWVHEIKTPIAAARLTIANHPGQATSAVAADLDRIDTYVEQALYYARSSSVDRDYVIRENSLQALVNDAVKARARELIERGVHIEAHDLDETVLCDAKWMRFCIGQVIENAAKYPAPDEAGRVPRITFAARRTGEGTADELVALTIRDNGRGIPAGDLPRLFDKGFVGENGRAADAARSTGIGLYLVRRLCEKMGIAVGVTSEEGAWTEVSFGFPMNRMHFLESEQR